MYPARLRLTDGNFAIRLAEIREWLQQHRIDPGLVRYDLGADHVRIRVEFTRPSHLAAFRAAFGETQMSAAADD